jgi:excisionase family DNA binding protein
LKTPEEPDTDRLLRPCEAAALFGVDRRTISNWAAAGKLTNHRTVGKHRRYREGEIRALIAGSTEIADAPVAAVALPENDDGPPRSLTPQRP